ncbi:lipocalin-like domain-containing protein [Oligoflexaceae bacterium]|nr:lipocalin-like domain-containing protein [Oligoflexaceae bacterium]
MKMLMVFVTYTLLITSTLNASPIDGVWSLKSFTVYENGQASPYCKGAHGHVVYEPSGFVSFAINCPTQTSKSNEKDVFYAGLFKIKGKSVLHYIMNASNQTLIKKTVTRSFRRQKNSLMLNGTFSGKSFSTVWIPVRR